LLNLRFQSLSWTFIQDLNDMMSYIYKKKKYKISGQVNRKSSTFSMALSTLTRSL
jgi:hypothetical protein